MWLASKLKCNLDHQVCTKSMLEVVSRYACGVSGPTMPRTRRETSLDWTGTRPGHVNSLPAPFSGDNIELHDISFSHALQFLVAALTCNFFSMEESVLLRVILLHEAVTPHSSEPLQCPLNTICQDRYCFQGRVV